MKSVMLPSCRGGDTPRLLFIKGVTPFLCDVLSSFEKAVSKKNVILGKMTSVFRKPTWKKKAPIIDLSSPLLY